MVPPRRRFFFRRERWLPFRRRLIERTSPERHWERGLSLSAIAFSYGRRVCTDGRAATRRLYSITSSARTSRCELRGPGLRFAVPRLQSSNDETPPNSGASREDHHTDTT